MSNAIIRQDGPGAVVADNLWEIRLGAVPFAAGLCAGVAGTVLALRRLHRAERSKAPAPTGWPVNIAHRGGAALVPENTLEGFREAVGLGEVTLELDVRTCADGEVVVIHDPTVDRTTDGTGAVSQKGRADLDRLDAGYRFPSDDAPDHPWRGRGVRVPTLEAVYRQHPDRPVVIELKDERPGAAEALWRAVEAAGAQDRTLVATNAAAPIRRFRRASGGTVPTAASVGEFAVFWLLSFLHLHRVHDPPFQALQPPEVYRGIRVVTPRLVRRAHEAGLRVDVWTVDDGADMRRLLGWGVDGIMTDRPDVLARILNEGATDV